MANKDLKIGITKIDNYVFFWGGIFSNWTTAKFLVDDNLFYTSEQYFMFMKAKTFNDKETAHEILKYGKDPKEAKKLGRKVKNYNDSVWNEIRYDIMFDAIKYKFDANLELKNELMSYHDNIIFVEASPVDKIWGIGMAVDNPNIIDESKWQGKNLLGKALTELRKFYNYY